MYTARYVSAVVVLDNFQDSRPAKTSERFHAGVLSPLLCHVERKTYGILDLFGKGGEVRFGASNPKDRLNTGAGRHHYIMPKRA